ncbi:MAG: hypothetical protein HGA23_02715, partial [Bacteroidales bacterium]|nr:hypothetical protein [Bacteroidales bacterium]
MESKITRIEPIGIGFANRRPLTGLQRIRRHLNLKPKHHREFHRGAIGIAHDFDQSAVRGVLDQFLEAVDASLVQG